MALIMLSHIVKLRRFESCRIQGMTLKTSAFTHSTNEPTITPQAVYFTGGGNFYYWQCGAALYLNEAFNLSSDDSLSLIGASAGSITAALFKLNADFTKSIDQAIDMANEAKLYDRKTELALVWGPLIREWLHEIVPDTVEPESATGLHITVTPALPLKRPKLVSNFQNKEDIIEAVMASIHVPVFLDGKPWTKCRGETVMDGSIWWFMTRDFNRKTCPVPDHIKQDRMFVVDWREDLPHRAKLRKEILGGPAFRALKPHVVYEMVEAGYLYMQKQHNEGKLPWESRDFRSNELFVS